MAAAGLRPRANFEFIKCLICSRKREFMDVRGALLLIHNFDRITLGITPNFPGGSNALAIGHFLLIFLSRIPTAAR
ncbi:MAG: hypothetical protein ACJ8R9_28435 [Steroidobacteraceae bacterium]